VIEHLNELMFAAAEKIERDENSRLSLRRIVEMRDRHIARLIEGIP
jgi:hypothetical protein